MLEKLPSARASDDLGETESGAPGSHGTSEGTGARRIGTFCLEVLEAVAPHVPCIKVQSACFERYGWQGIAALEQVMRSARNLGLVTILDAKRGDIGISSEHYAAAAAHLRADWVTASPYAGREAIDPFVRRGIGVFALVRTSNPSGDELQMLELADGRSVAEAAADCVRAWGEATTGASGIPLVGAVVGATRREEAGALRALLGQAMILVPGFGAQGGGMDDVLPCFLPGGRGAIVTASRSVIYAEPREDETRMQAVARAAAQLAAEIGKGTGLR